METTTKVLVHVSNYLTQHSIPFILGVLATVLLSAELAITVVFGLTVYNFLFKVDKEVVNK